MLKTSPTPKHLSLYPKQESADRDFTEAVILGGAIRASDLILGERAPAGVL